MWRKLERLRAGLRNEDGAMSVEFVIWMPIFLTILGFAVDATSLFLTQHDMANVARDVARRMSTGELTAAAAEIYAKSTLLYGDRAYDVATVAGNTDATVTIRLPMSDADVFGIFAPFTDGDLGAQTTMRLEAPTPA